MLYAYSRERGQVLATRTRRAGGIAVALLAAISLGLTACTGNGNGGGADEVNTLGGDVATSLDEAVSNAMQLSGATEAVVGVWTASGDYVRAYGENLSASAPIRAAQASQPVMCAALLSLVEEGTLKLDRAVARDLPRQVGLDDITYGQLCEATSGLADFKSAGWTDIYVSNPTRPWSDRELLAQSLAHSPLAAPGTEQHVSDTNALLLARALQQATGVEISELLEEHVFSAADMDSSHYPTDVLLQTELPEGGMNGLSYPSSGGAPVCTVPGENEGETVPAEPIAIDEVSPSMLGGAGATVTTITDLKKFYEAYAAGAFGGGGDGLVKTISAPAPEPAEGEEAPAEGEEAAEPPTDGWTFGLEKQGPLYGMSGAMTGTITAAYHDPDGKFSVVVALNNSSAGASFARALAFQLAALAGEEVPWAAEDQANALSEKAVCQPAADEAAAE